MKFNVTLMSPIGYVHGLALLELAEFINNQIIRCGYISSLSKNRVIYDGINIILGAHIQPEKYVNLADNCIIFNSEQLSENSTWTNTDYKNILKNNYVWDYSSFNLNCITHNNKSLIYLNFDKNLRRINLNHEKEWDILFYGSLNDRRIKILDRLDGKGLKIKRLFGVYGPERDHFLSNCRSVLNLHFYDSQILQQIRIFYPLINRIPVISENYPINSGPEFYKKCLFTPGTINFEEYVSDLLNDNEQLFNNKVIDKVAEFELTENTEDFNKVILSAIKFFSINSKSQIPNNLTKINLGSGKDYKIGFLNLDIKPNTNPDIVLDLSKKINLPFVVNSKFHGNITFQENQFIEIIAIDVLEHVQNLELLMTNCLKLLSVGGKLIISVPYELSYGAWQDPTHVRAFNQNSWIYYTDWFWYLGWFDYKFELLELNFLPSALGKNLIEKNIDKDVILSTPRAIESMSVIFVKRQTNFQEKNLARSYGSNLVDYF
jgi:hypothetical protein